MATVRKVIEVPDEPKASYKHLRESDAEFRKALEANSFLKPGQICNLPINGRTMTGYEYLGTDGVFLKFRGDTNVSPMTAILLIPVGKVEAVGLVGAYE